MRCIVWRLEHLQRPPQHAVTPPHGIKAQLMGEEAEAFDQSIGFQKLRFPLGIQWGPVLWGVACVGQRARDRGCQR